MSRTPHMDEEILQFFSDALRGSKCYLEFGCGGSTVYACMAARVENVISVDTSYDWVQKIKEETVDSGVNLHISFIDLGEVGDWGVPKGTSRQADFWRYSVEPWRTAKQLTLCPDTVLIDGRFRVACFLYTLLSARVGTTIIVDDYFNRPEYFVIEKFCSLDIKVGRAAIFRASRSFNISDLVADYARYSIDCS